MLDLWVHKVILTMLAMLCFGGIGRCQYYEFNDELAEFEEPYVPIKKYCVFIKTNGVVIDTTRNGDSTRIIEYRDGLRHGLSIEFSGGKRIEEGTFNNGCPFGLWKTYKQPNTIDSKFYNDSLERVAGRCLLDTAYTGTKYCEGLDTTLYEGGEIYWICNYTDSIMNGIFKEYYRSGNIEISGTVKNGIRTGVWKVFYNDGQLKKRIVYYSIGQIKEYSNYYADGELISSVKYTMDGDVIELYEIE